jgi:hypothetical protein
MNAIVNPPNQIERLQTLIQMGGDRCNAMTA